MALGYLGDPERTAERFVDHQVTGERLYRTGDLGRYRSDGVIEFLGRADSQVKVLGHRIELGEIESALERHPSVGAACVLADGERTDRRLVAFVTGRRRTPDAGTAVELTAAADTAGRSAAQAPDAERMRAVHRALDAAVLLSVGHALREAIGEGRTADEVLRHLRVVPRHRWIVRRWLGLLHQHGGLDQDPVTGVYTALALPDSGSEAEAAWRRVRELHARGQDQWSPEAVALFERGVEIQLRYFPLHLVPEWRARGHGPGECPTAERLWFTEQLNLPCHAGLTNRQVDHLVWAFADSLDEVVPVGVLSVPQGGRF